MASVGGHEGDREEEEEVTPPPPSTFPLQGHLLEEVLSHLPTVDLVPTQYVSTAWQEAVHTSLRLVPRSKPWLLLHSQRRRNPSAVVIHAYDPHCQLWFLVPLPQPYPLSSALRSSPGCCLLYEVTGSRLAVCPGSLGATWRSFGPTREWRTDPVVAAVGDRVLVAGGSCGFLDGDPCAVDVYLQDGVATACEPIPQLFVDSASATFLSVAASDRKMYIIERNTGLLCSLEVETGAWGRPALLHPDPSLFSFCIAFSGSRLILTALGRDTVNSVTLTLWAVNDNSLQCQKIGCMPEDMLEHLAGGDVSLLSSIDISVVGEFAYVCKASDPARFVSCDFAGGDCRWTEVRAPVGLGENPAERCAFTCSEVGMDDLRRVFWSVPAGRGRRPRG